MLPMNIFARKVSPPQRILVVTLADLGDALLTTPALCALRAAFPTARIDVLTTPVGAAMLRHEPAIDQVIVFEKHRFDYPRQAFRWSNVAYVRRLWRELHAARYDTCVMLHHFSLWFGTLKYAALAYASGAPRRVGLDNGRGFFLTERVADQGFGARHQVEYWLDVVALLGAQRGDRSPRFPLPAEAQQRAARILGTNDPAQTLIALHPGTGAYAPARRWPPDRWGALADALIDDGATVVLVGGREEAALRQAALGAMRHRERVIDLGGQTSLEELAAVLADCTLFVGNDSGLGHLAASVGTPVVSVFGPTDPRAYGPYAAPGWEREQSLANGVDIFRAGPHTALKAAIACSPCIYRGHNLGTPHGCPDRTCLQRIGVEQVRSLIARRLRELNEACVSTTL